MVDKKEHSCSCRRWQLTGIPCHHAIASMNINNENPELYLHKCYKVSTYLQIYSHFINPTNGKQLWPKSNQPPIIAPEPVNFRRGRKIFIRRREADEVQRGGQGPRGGGLPMEGAPIQPVRISRRGGQMKCSSCGGKGHNVRSCKGKQPVSVPSATQPQNEAIETQAHPHDTTQVQGDIITQEALLSQVNKSKKISILSYFTSSLL